MSKGLKTAGVVLAVIIAFIVIFAWVFDWNWLRGYIGEKVTEKTGREFVIAGNLDVDLSLTPRVRMERVRFANAAWGRERNMLDIEVLEFTIDLARLFTGRVLLPEVALSRPAVVLEKSKDGRKNWVLDKQQKGDAALPEVGRLVMDKGTLVFRDPVINTDVRVDLATAARNQDLRQAALLFKAQGHYKGLPSSAEGRGGSVLMLRDMTRAYPINTQLQVGATRATLNGTITGLDKFSAAELNVDLQGKSLADLFPIFGVILPASPPYHIKGYLSHTGDVWEARDFSGGLGDSDIAGTIKIDIADKRPKLSGKLVSRTLDVDDLAGFIGAPPKTGPGETATTEQKKVVAELEKKTRVLPDKEFKLEQLQKFDADITLTGKSIKREGLPLDDLKVHLILHEGELKLNPLNFGVAGGNVISQIALDARRNPMVFNTDIQFKQLSLKRLIPKLDMSEKSAGIIGGRAQLGGAGNSFAKLMASADGQMGFAMSGGQISNLLLEYAGIDGAEIMKFLFGGDKSVPVRCGVADFKVTDGVMKTEVLVFDTQDTNVKGEGSINLNNESLNLTLRPYPKDASILSLRSPLQAKGTFKDPEFAPDMTSIGGRGGAAVVLGALINPLAALIPLIETGPGKDSNCAALIAAVGTDTKPGKQAPQRGPDR